MQILKAFITSLIIGLPNLCATAYEHSHLVNGPVETLSYHYRLKLNKHNATKFGIKWNITDSINYRYANLESYGAAAEDSWGDYVTLTIGRKYNGTDSVFIDKKTIRKLDLTRIGTSLRLDVGEGGCILSIGSKKIEEEFVVNYDTKTSSIISAWADCDIELLRDDLRISGLETPKYSNLESIKNLTDHITHSDDPYEGVWVYFDRNTDALRSRMGGYYTIATIKTDVGYDILYISGAEIDAELWQALQIKGQLTEATFPGSFDLVWIEPSGRKLDYETSATIIDNLLTIRLPHWDATVRFRRIEQNQLSQ